MKHLFRSCLLILFITTLVACGGNDDPPPTQEENTATPIIVIVTATPDPAMTATSEAIALETETPTDAPTNTAIPSASLSQQRVSPPTFAYFTTTTTNINAVHLAQRISRVGVSWRVDNRPSNTNLVFEQVLDNGAILNVELPRLVELVSSAGSGQLAPFLPLDSSNQINLRVRLINLSNDATIISSEIIIPVVGYDTVYDFFDGSSCFDSPFLADSGLIVSGSGFVTQNVTVGLPISTLPRIGGNILTGLPASETFTVVDGPRCFHPAGANPSASYRMWQIRTNTHNTLGWVHEYDSAGIPLIAPIDNGNDDIIVNSFSVEPLEVNEGEPITVSWDVEGVDGIYIMLAHSRQRFGWGQVNPDLLPASGSYTFDASHYVNRAQITLTGIVDGETGQGGTLDGSFDVTINCLHDWFVTPIEPYPYCPESPVATVQFAYQPFENGFMLWHDSKIWAFIDGGSGVEVIDSWSGQDIEYAETPPDGMVLPQNGFGWEWVNNEWLRNSLGWAISQEQGYNAQFQYSPSSGWIGAYYAVSLPDGEVISFQVNIGSISYFP